MKGFWSKLIRILLSGREGIAVDDRRPCDLMLRKAKMNTASWQNSGFGHQYTQSCIVSEISYKVWSQAMAERYESIELVIKPSLKGDSYSDHYFILSYNCAHGE